jgi:HD-GYP domain-containing protein (c-di-GMP phosphodiesterase class II)
VGERVGATPRWRARPAGAAALRAAAYVLPVAASVAVGVGAAEALPAPSAGTGRALWWAALVSVAVVTVFVTDRVTRRLLPLAALLRLSMAFPDQAPSRRSIARRLTGRNAVARELERVRRHGVSGGPQEAAESVLSIVGALDEYDGRRRGHSERTHLYVSRVAEQLRLSQDDRDRLLWVALAHDIGKARLPHSVLDKPDTPTGPEWRILYSHPEHGAEICAPLRDWLGDWWLAIEQHHERFDGTGYPRGLAGHDISYGARIVAVADSFDTMTSARSYRRPMSDEDALWELMRCAGTQFDPDVVSAFIRASSGRTSAIPAAVVWAAQLLLVRPGRYVGSALAGLGTAAAVVATVALLGLSPSVVDASPDRHAQPHPTRAPATTDPTSHGGPSSGPSSSAPSTKPPTTLTPGTPGSTRHTSHATTIPTVPGPTVPPPSVPGQTTANSAPTARLDRVTAREDARRVRFRPLANDRDADGDPLTIVSVGHAGHGRVWLRASGALVYRPAPDFTGVERLVYDVADGRGGWARGRVAIRVRRVNDAPAVGPAAYATVAGRRLAAPASRGALAAASDVDGDRLRVVRDSSRAVDIRPDGSISYRAVAPTTLAVRFVVSDGQTTTAATLTITVSADPLTRHTLYLRPADTDERGRLTPRRPAGAMRDWDHDGHAGLTIASGRLTRGADASNTYQEWGYRVPSRGMHVAGPVSLDVWTKLHGRTQPGVEYAAWLEDCGPSGSCRTLLQTGPVQVTDGSAQSWQRQRLTLGALSATVTGGHTLRLQLMVHGADVLLALDSRHPGALTLLG